MKKKYRISIAEGNDARLKGVLGYEGEHAADFSDNSFKFFYNKNMDDKNAGKNSILASFKENLLAKKDFKRGGAYSSIAAHIPFGLCMYSIMLKEAMQEFAPGQNYSFTYFLRNPAKQGDKPEMTLWNTDCYVKMDDNLDNDFYLDVEGVGVFPVSIEEVSDLEKIAESSVEQRQETAAGTD